MIAACPVESQTQHPLRELYRFVRQHLMRAHNFYDPDPAKVFWIKDEVRRKIPDETPVKTLIFHRCTALDPDSS